MLAALAFAANALSDHEQQHPTHQRIYFGNDHQSYVTSKTPPQDDFYRYPLGVGGIAFYGMIIIVLLLIARGTRKDETFGLQPPRSWPNALALTGAVLVVTYIAVVLLGLALGPEGHPDQGLPTFWDGTRLPQFALSFIAIAVIAPVVEELAFRGLGFSLLQPYGTRAAIGGTAVLFGLMHGYLVALPIFILVGVALAWLRSRTDSVYPGMLMHGTFNATAVALTISFS